MCFNNHVKYDYSVHDSILLGDVVKSSILQKIFSNEEDLRVARILQKIIFSLLAIYLVIIGMALYWEDNRLILFTVFGIIALLIPYGLLLRKHLHISAFIVVSSVLFIVTLIATDGQGIHDIAIMSYPVIIVITSLLLPRRILFWVSAFTLVAAAWLVFGEIFGLFIPQTFSTPKPPDFIIVFAILMIAIFVVDMVSENMRGNLRQAHQELSSRKKMETQLRHISIHDSLTGIFNRAYFEEKVTHMDHLKEFPVSIIVVDVDDLKVINDTRGHAVGDELLRQASIVLSAAFRTDDVLARIGGDEFAVLLPNTDGMIVEHILARIHNFLAEHNASHADLPVKLSIGTATAQEGNLMETFILADQRMYANKAARKAQKQSK